MYINNEFIFDMIAERVREIQLRLDEINNLMPDDITYKALRQLSKEIIELGRELRDL